MNWELSELTWKVRELAVETGAFIREERKKFNRERIEKKHAHDYVSYVDKESERRIVACLREWLPEAGFVAEEGSGSHADEEYCWVVDPLDGTVEFIKGNNEFTVNIALMENNRSVASVVYVPYLGKMYLAWRGGGAFLKEGVAADSDAEYSYGQIVESMRRLPVESARHEHPRVAVSRSHKSPELAEYIEELRKSHPDLEVVEQGSSYKFCLLAEGAVDYYFRTTSTYEWDTAAGELILSEAGGETLSLPDYRPLRYNKTDLVNSWFFCRARKMPGCRSEAEMMVGECSAAD